MPISRSSLKFVPNPSAVVTGTVPDPRSAPPIRWGILGAGGIASSFAEAVRLHHRQLLDGTFWQRIPAYRLIDEATFLDHNWQAKNTITISVNAWPAHQRSGAENLPITKLRRLIVRVENESGHRLTGEAGER